MLNDFCSYRSHKNFLASYLGTGAEQEKLQKPAGDVVVWERNTEVRLNEFSSIEFADKDCLNRTLEKSLPMNKL